MQRQHHTKSTPAGASPAVSRPATPSPLATALLAGAVALLLCATAAPADPTPPATAATPSIAAQRDRYQQQLAEALRQQEQLARQVEQLRGAVLALSQFAPTPTAKVGP